MNSENRSQQMKEEHEKELLRFLDETKGILKKTTSLEKLEQEKLQLSNKVEELQIAFEKAKESATSTDYTAVNAYKDDNLAIDGQVDFLNSVIVDMQKKNDLLQARIQILEAGQSMTDDINLNGIRAPLILPRLFCDICEIFDVHDTEDCPTQVSSSPLPQHGIMKTCKVFDQWTNQCNNNNIF